ncbi:hypothetical protein LSAT2_008807 [Lamellibrachia satsuma]|nr:hypothetical protein LSAT2_008807 [Lamellibrachia satsuma]
MHLQLWRRADEHKTFYDYYFRETMAWKTIGILLVALGVASALKTCYQSVESYRMPWLPATLYVDDPLASYLPPDCCAPTDQGRPFDAQQECHLCYEKTKSTPGFAADPNTCQRFVMCEPDGQGGWNTFNMTCPVCTFWNQELLTCVQVYDGPMCEQTHIIIIIVIVVVLVIVIIIIIIKIISSSINSITTTIIIIIINVNTNVIIIIVNMHESGLKTPLMFCIDFEDDDLVSNTAGVYRPWILNDGVTVVADAQCPQGQRCGFFNESVLEGAAMGPWVDVQMTWNGVTLDALVNDVSNSPSALFPGPIRNSHCPLMIGAFIKDRIPSYFQGYMDNICFYKW